MSPSPPSPSPSPSSSHARAAVPISLSPITNSLTYNNNNLRADPLGLVAAGAVVFGVQKLTKTYDASWYAAVKKPSWTPPNWAFPAAWIPLKALQSVGLWLAYRQITAGLGSDTGAKARALALPVGVFGVMLGLGNYWNVVFFGQRRMKASIKVMGAFWASVVASAAAFWHAGSPLAGLLVAPTSIWVTVAAKLNWDIVQLNPDLHEKDQ